MSRDYGSYPRFGLRRRSRLRIRMQPGCAVFVMGVLLLIALWFFWLTRSTTRMENFIPRESAYEIYTTDLLETAQRVAGSRVWDLIPDERPEYDLRYLLAGGLPLPEWLIRNLFYGLCHVSGNDLDKFQDAVIVTQITRVGSMVERLRFLIGAIETDEAGGLNLRSLPDVGIFYAVRGRVLLVSMSRDALIDSLTLQENQAVEYSALAERVAELMDADLVLHVRKIEGKTSPQLVMLFENANAIKATLRTEQDQLQISFHASLTQELQQQYSALLDGMRPQTLKRGHEAMLGMSWNFGVPLKEIWADAGSGLGQEIALDQLLPLSEEGTPENVGPVAFISALADVLGGSGRIMLRSVNQNEMLPAPELVGLFETDTAKVQALMTSLEPWLEGDGALTYAPFYDVDSKTVRMPLLGGPSMELTAAEYGGELLLGTSRPASLALMKEAPVTETLNQEGNLYVVARPAPLAEEIVKAGAQLAEAGLLRDLNPETFQQTADKWLKAAHMIDTLAAIAAYDKGALTLEFRLGMAATQ